MDMGPDEVERGRVHVDGPVPEEPDASPLRDSIGHRRAVDTHRTGHGPKAYTIVPQVGSAPDHQLPQDVEVEIVESVHWKGQGLRCFGLDGSAKDDPRNPTRNPKPIRVPRDPADKDTSRD